MKSNFDKPNGTDLKEQPDVELKADDIAASAVATAKAPPHDKQSEQVSRGYGRAGQRELLRHALVVGTCITICVVLTILGSIDLHRFVQDEVSMDSNFNVIHLSKPQPLPGNLRYVGEQDAIYGGVPHPDGMIEIFEAQMDSTLYGFADIEGHIVIKPQFEAEKPFSEGLSAVYAYGKHLWGFIDKSGHMVIPPRFDTVTSFSDGAAMASIKNDTFLIDKRGNKLWTFAKSQSDMPRREGRLFLEHSHNLSGLVDKQHNWVVPPLYYEVLALEPSAPKTMIENYPNNDSDNENEAAELATLYNGPAMGRLDSVDHTSPYFKVTNKEGGKGIVDSNGHILMPCKYDEILSYQDGHAVVSTDGLFGMVDTQGNWTVKPIFNWVTPYGDLIAARKGQKWRFFGKKGNELKAPAVDGILTASNNNGLWFTDGRAPVIVGDRIGYLNAGAQFAIEPKFKFGTLFSDGFAKIWDGTYWRYIDRDGNLPSPLKFAAVGSFKDGHTIGAIAGPLYPLTATNQIDQNNSMISNTVKFIVSPDPDPDPLANDQ